jgi:hypothetical protein
MIPIDETSITLAAISNTENCEQILRLSWGDGVQLSESSYSYVDDVLTVAFASRYDYWFEIKDYPSLTSDTWTIWPCAFV